MAAGILDPEVWAGQVYIGGWRLGDGAVVRDVVEPATGKVLGATGGATDVALAAASAASAARAQPSWARVAGNYHVSVLRRAAAACESHGDEIARWLIQEGGAVRAKAIAEVRVAVQTCHAAAALAGAPYGEVIRSMQARMSLVRRTPAGVVGVMTPFNMPLTLAIRTVAPALALGNAVLIKADLRTIVSGEFALARVFEQAGLPGDCSMCCRATRASGLRW